MTDPKITGNGDSDDDLPLYISSRDDTTNRGGDDHRIDDAATDVDDESAEETVLGIEVDRSGGADDDEEIEPVELLVQLADDGEIDPWDIDVVRVTDKFLERLDDADLRTGGRALFYASVLVRMKSDVMLAPDEPGEEPDPEPWDLQEGDAPPAADPITALEHEMDRRIERKRARGMPETLDGLVRDLRERERENFWKASRTYDTSESPSGFARGTQTLDYHTDDDFRMDDEPTADDVTGTAHDEQMEDVINQVYLTLQTHYDAGRAEVLFAEIPEAGGSVVNTFLGLLFLAHRGRIQLHQDEFFGDLWIRDPAAVAELEPAPADD
ncbi:MAG: segregation/condensation protein A [Natronomonas sp.]